MAGLRVKLSIHITGHRGQIIMMLYCIFVTSPCGVLGKVCYVIVSIPDLYLLSYFFYSLEKYFL